ncbi:hypothetical protein BKH41_05970 [Helicobacter sp. 12S02232-10]|uniref:outer membrane beta-barrel protein n=1 Tax=Helicobacter sp. 12S02232-10 TaxID=1476197 RepID=UPI000BA4F70F|nr:outer membrane beta-barrel protein [Helicobacter sp. 12S02232-10]PAF48259.1 hypothetical protein BKH41_05970 [Helicobacter sp. 12S02232-10]
MQVFQKTIQIFFMCGLFFGFLNAQKALMLGIDFGDNINNENFLKATSTLDTQSGFNPSIGLKMGYQYYFRNFLGFRAYVGANYVNMKKSITYNHAGGLGPISSKGNMEYSGFSFSGNIDVLLKYDFTKNFALGIYGGIGYEGTFFKDSKVAITAVDPGALELFGNVNHINGNGLIYNLGFHTLIAQSHQFEIGVKFAPYNINSRSNLSNRIGDINNLGLHSQVKMGTLAFIGYRYLFNLD